MSYLRKKIDIMFNDTPSSNNLLAVLKPEKELRTYTLAKYLHREERGKELREYYDGIITKLPIANALHNLISANMSTALNIALNSKGNNYIVTGGRQLIYVEEPNYGLYPDVIVIEEKPDFYDNDEVLLTNPTLIVEVLPRSNRKDSRYQMFWAYISLPSFQEYVLVNPEKCRVETRFREEPNLWRDTIYTEMSDSIYLKSLDCSIPLSLIYRNIQFPQPKN